jgi:hypothetical protein
MRYTCAGAGAAVAFAAAAERRLASRSLMSSSGGGTADSKFEEICVPIDQKYISRLENKEVETSYAQSSIVVLLLPGICFSSSPKPVQINRPMYETAAEAKSGESVAGRDDLRAAGADRFFGRRVPQTSPVRCRSLIIPRNLPSVTMVRVALF